VPLFDGADLSSAVLAGADFTGANIYGTVFKGAKGLAEVNGLDHAKNRDKATFRRQRHYALFIVQQGQAALLRRC
jgi:uncharacterized protein YjbI with pentapeptide repeats